jgi:hypothetical protein
LEKAVQCPLFPLNPRLLFPKLKFWNSLGYSQWGLIPKNPLARGRLAAGRFILELALAVFRLKPYKTAFFKVGISKFDILKSPPVSNLYAGTAYTQCLDSFLIIGYNRIN